MRAYIYDIMLMFSILIMTLGIVGIWRMPDIYTKLHGASKSVLFGVVLMAASATVVAETPVIYRVILVSMFVIVTTPISSHVIGRAAYLMQERMETPGAVDESQKLLKDQDPTWRL